MNEIDKFEEWQREWEERFEKGWGKNWKEVVITPLVRVDGVYWPVV